MGLQFNYETYSFYIAPCNGLQGAEVQYAANLTRNTGANPLLFSVSALGSFMFVTQHLGPTAFRPIRKTKQWLSVLLNDTGLTTGTRTHTLLIRNSKGLNPVLLTARP